MDHTANHIDKLVFYVNGKKVEDNQIDPEWTLLFYLRNKLRLCGTKLGCGEGGCGACTVMVSKFDRVKQKVFHLPVNACLAPVCSMHGLAVTTVEGIGSTKTKLHPVQERIAKAHGSQCGFCTPGIVMSMYTLLRNNPTPNLNELEVAFQGNLCRCTGYRPIIEGFKTFTEEWEMTQRVSQMTNGAPCGLGDKCCRNGGTEEPLYEPSEFLPYHPTQEPIFPPELKLSDRYDKEFLVITGERSTWYRPTELPQLLQLKTKFPDGKVVVGNTEIGVEMKFKNMIYPTLIQPTQIPELNEIKIENDAMKIGAAVTLIEIEKFMRKQIDCLPEEKTRLLVVVVKMMNFFAGKQIRSVGSLGSNIMTGSPISDMIPIMMAANVTLHVQSSTTSRYVKFDNNFFTGYRKSILKPEEVLTSIIVPFSRSNQYFFAHKQARRREDDIAIVNTCINVTFQDNTNIISEIKVAFGGMSYKTLLAVKTAVALNGLPWNRETLDCAFEYLIEDLPLNPGAPGGMINYRRSLTLSLFFKGFLAISKQLQENLPGIELSDKELSGIEDFHFENFKSSQYYKISTHSRGPVHRPLIHSSAFKQACGEAIYCDDIPSYPGELYMAFVLSTEAHATITTIDSSEALKMEGVKGCFTAKNLNGDKLYHGTIVHDEKVFYSDEVTSQGQIVAAIVADDQFKARLAAKKVKVLYEKKSPVILTVNDAIKHNSYIGKAPHRIIKRGDIMKLFATAPFVLEGDGKIGGQEHFYLETQTVIVVPKIEDDEIEIHSSTQNPTELSKLVARMLGLPQSKVVTKVKRLGGGFGGKESKSCIVGLPAALAAHKLGRPIRVALDRDEDMVMTGGRHPFHFKYKVAFDKTGKILGCKINLYANAGYSMDLTPSLLERAMTHFENAYKIPIVHVEGYMCKTNLPSNTAFRGFGSPQGMYAGETIIQDIADYLGKDVTEIRELNLYKEGDLTHYNQKLVNCTIRKCWQECLQNSNYHFRRRQIEVYNRRNLYKKRGISVVPTKFGISFTATFMNQNGALVLVYTDGSVLISHGGVEMGQGLYTKTLQVASNVLGIPVSEIHISETSTDKVPNTPPTAASTGSDLNGMAVLEACTTIMKRLEPYRRNNPNGTWKDWVMKAYLDRVSLAATGFYKTPDIQFEWDKGEGNLFNYFTYGTACTEVEIDTLTGDHQVLRSDIVMDLGESINPAIDIGQIEGAFMQGYGLFVLEEMVYSPSGTTFTRGPGTYKIPGFADIPKEFNVSLLTSASNPRAVYSSKAVGEPPLFLASSVFYAIKNAIRAARISNGFPGDFKLTPPATVAKIRMACEDAITSKFKEPDPSSYKPWNVDV